MKIIFRAVAREIVPFIINSNFRVCSFLFQCFNAEIPVFHLSAIGFESHWTCYRNFERLFEDFTVTGAVGDVVLYNHLDFIPILGFIVLKVFVGTCYQVIATL